MRAAPPETPRRGPRAWLSAWLPVLCFELLVIYVSSRPHLRVPAGVPYLDKAAHFGEYAVLGGLLARALRLSGAGPLWAVLAAVLIAAALGGADERFQRMIPGRFSSVADWGMDVAGALAGSLVFRKWMGSARTSRRKAGTMTAGDGPGGT